MPRLLRNSTLYAGFVVLVLVAHCNAIAGASPPPDAQKALQIYFVDVEGGQATLFVTPAGQSLLVDTGWAGNDGRDGDRIVAAAKDAGVGKIDFVLITHYHLDHTGGIPQLAARIPIETFIDHGENREPNTAATQQVWQAYQSLLATKKYQHITAKPGDLIPLRSVRAEVISSDGALIDKPLPGAGQRNPACAVSDPRPTDDGENPRSLGTLITFGQLRILDLGDLTWDKELQLMCPVNKLGHVDLFIVSHHGSYSSNSTALVHGIAPRLAVMDNGAKKGGAPAVWDVLEKSPGLESLWQLHYAEQGGDAHNVAAEFIANLSGPDAGNYLKLTAFPDGSFDIFNSRTKTSKHYEPRR